MGDLDRTATKFFDKEKDPPAQSGWARLYQALGGAPSAVASQDIPQNNKPPASNGVTDPYSNFANKATGQPYK